MKTGSGHSKNRTSASHTDNRQIAMRFLELLGAMKRYVREELPPFPDRGMSDQRFRTLLSLKLLGKSPLKSLASRDGLSPSAQCIMLDRLVEEGFARRSPDARDRRRVIYELSNDGLADLDVEIERRGRLLGSRLQGLDIEERRRVSKAIDVLLQGIAKMRGQAAGSFEKHQ